MITIRPATLSDIPKVQEMHTQLFMYEDEFMKLYNLNYDQQVASKEYFLSRLQPKNGRIFIAQEDDEIVGFLCAGKSKEEYREVQKYAEIESLFVAEGHRGNQAGKKLMDSFKEWAASEGITRLKVEVVHTNLRTFDFYQREGFRPTYLKLESSPIENL